MDSIRGGAPNMYARLQPLRPRRPVLERRYLAALLGVALMVLLATVAAAGATSPSRVARRPLPRAPQAIDGAVDTSGLHVAGGRLQNGAGQVVQLHGVNRSSWEYICLDGSGQTHDG